MKKERHLIYINTEYIHTYKTYKTCVPILTPFLNLPSSPIMKYTFACLFDLVYTLHWIFIAINFEDYVL